MHQRTRRPAAPPPEAPALPPEVAALLAAAPALGVTGSRRPPAAALAALGALLAAAPAAPILVGDARGIDARARQLRPDARVFRAGDDIPLAQALARRSIACVRATAALGGALVALPAQPCPPGLRPSADEGRCFGGFGMGTWSSLALGLGLQLPVIVFLPPGVPAPWPALAPAGAGWHLAAPRPAQLALF